MILTVFGWTAIAVRKSSVGFGCVTIFHPTLLNKLSNLGGASWSSNRVFVRCLLLVGENSLLVDAFSFLDLFVIKLLI